jgi:DNA-binding NarL/FixJ family response regulator
MTKVIIADDHLMFRKFFLLYLNRDQSIEVVGEAENGNVLLDMVKENPDVELVFLDIEMPHANGLAVLKQLFAIRPDLNVLVISQHPEEVYGIASRKLGAKGFISKTSEPRYILKAVRRIITGGEYFNNDILMKARPSDLRKSYIKLSRRESEVLSLLAMGKSNKTISEELQVSDKTVSTYKLRLLKKLNVKSLVELVNFAKYYGINPEIELKS